MKSILLIFSLLLSANSIATLDQDRLDRGLFDATVARDGNTVKYFLANGADPNRVDVRGRTPLFVAAANGDTPIVNMLLEHQADMSFSTQTGETPMSVALANGHGEVATALQEQGDLDAQLFRQVLRRGNVNSLLALGANPNRPVSDGSTPLSVASNNGDIEIARALLARRARVNVQTATRQTPIGAALAGRHLALASLLANHGLIQRVSGRTQADIQSASAIDAYENDVRRLLDQGADPNFEDTRGRTALFLASENGDTSIVSILLSRRARVDSIQTSTGSTPLMMAAYYGHRSVLFLLLNQNPHIDLQNFEDHNTALYYASHSNVGTSATRSLVRSGARYHRTDIPLLTARLNGQHPLQVFANAYRALRYERQMLTDRIARVRPVARPDRRAHSHSELVERIMGFLFHRFELRLEPTLPWIPPRFFGLIHSPLNREFHPAPVCSAPEYRGNPRNSLSDEEEQEGKK